jgi:hypothetical protein
MFLLVYGLFVRTWRDVPFAGLYVKRLAIFPGGDHFDVPKRSIVSPIFRHVADGVLVANASGDFLPDAG